VNNFATCVADTFHCDLQSLSITFSGPFPRILFRQGCPKKLYTHIQWMAWRHFNKLNLYIRQHWHLVSQRI